MDSLIRAAADVQKVLDARRWKYCFIGGLAVQKWGQARFTHHIDLTVMTGLGSEEQFIDALLGAFAPRVKNARSFAIENRIVLLRTTTGVDLDISCGGFPFEEKAIARARKVQMIPGVHLRLCTAEDLIVYKTFAGRAIDWADVESIIAKRSGKLDWRHVYAQLKPLARLKDDPRILPNLKALRRVVEKQ